MVTGAVNIAGVLSVLEQYSLAKTLAQPTLVALSGQQAETLIGGEVPIPIAQVGNRITIEYKEYGVKLVFVPTVLSSPPPSTPSVPRSVSVTETPASPVSPLSCTPLALASTQAKSPMERSVTRPASSVELVWPEPSVTVPVVPLLAASESLVSSRMSRLVKAVPEGAINCTE